MSKDRNNIGLRIFSALWRQLSKLVCPLLMATMAKGLFYVLLSAGFTFHQTATADAAAEENSAALSASEPQRKVARHPKRANFKQESPSPEARHVADWIVDSGDNRSMPFVIVDKTNAKVFVFYPDGQLRGAAPALLGLALGDDIVPGIGDRKLSGIRPEERTTPAGRFVASLGRNLRGVEILWVDYEGAISLHQVITSNPRERRLERLASPKTTDRRISYGCINVPAKFYKNVVRQAFTGTKGIVYVLPETKSVREVFGAYDVGKQKLEDLEKVTDK